MQNVTQVDWASLATVLADLKNLPTLVLDREMRIQLFNDAAEKLLNTSRYEALGRPFPEVCANAESDVPVGACFEQALHGIKRVCETRARLRDGRHLVLSFDLKAIGRGEQGAVLATVAGVREDGAHTAPRFEGDLHYDVDIAPATFGYVRKAWTGDAAHDAELIGKHCYQVFRRGTSACPTCPAKGLAPGQSARSAIVRLKDQGNRLLVVNARPLSADTARISARQMDEGILNDLVRAKADELSERGKLSGREREVLQQLLAGRALEEISEQLSISQRTVKFHQANILTKLGADSRLDLLRLIF